MRTLWLVPGLALITFALSDATATTLSTSVRAGPLTRLVTTAVWRAALSAHARWPCHGRLAALGPTLLVSGLVQWLVLLWAGWSMVFASQPGAVVLADSREPAGLLDVAYFAGVSLFSLGTGDVVAATSSWRAVSVLTVATGLFVLTLSLSYFVSVLAAVSERRVLAVRLTALGASPQDILLTSWRDTSFSPYLGTELSGLAEPVARLTEQHVTYHVLHYFHPRDRRAAAVLGLARLDEALSLLEHAVDPAARPDRVLTAPLRAQVGRLLEVIEEAHRTTPPDDEPPALEIAGLRAAGVPLVRDGVAFSATARAEITERRRALAALVASDGWSWTDVSGGGT